MATLGVLLDQLVTTCSRYGSTNPASRLARLLSTVHQRKLGSHRAAKQLIAK